MLNIIQAIRNLKVYLDGQFKTNEYALQYKTSDNPNQYEVSTPHIYTFTCPSEDLIDAYPKYCPAIVLTVDSHDEDNIFKCTAHTCVCNPSIADKEIAQAVEGIENRFVFKDDDKYNVGGNADNALIESSIYFTEQLFKYLSTYEDCELSEINVNMPEPSLPDFPFCTTTISFNMQINYNKIGQTKWDELF